MLINANVNSIKSRGLNHCTSTDMQEMLRIFIAVLQWSRVRSGYKQVHAAGNNTEDVKVIPYFCPHHSVFHVFSTRGHFLFYITCFCLFTCTYWSASFFFTNSTLQPANIICFGRVSFCANGMMSVTLMKNLEGLCSWLAPVNTPGAVLEKDSWLLIDIPRSSKTCWWLANPNRRYLIHCHTFLVSHTRWLTGNIFVWVLFYWKILHSIPLKP